jgi:uncharacterized protein YndB with AHSA1/START domain
MSVTSVHKDPEARTLTITADFDASADRVWQLWADPRQIERWWGPPGLPLTVVEHDLSPSGKVSYFVATPDGDRISGWWHILTVDPPRGLDFDLSGPDLPTMTTRVSIEPRPTGGTRMTINTSFPTDAAMEHMLSIGFDQGVSTAVAQIDDLLRSHP